MEDGKLPLANSYFPMLVVFPGPSCIPGLVFLFLVQPEQAPAQLAHQAGDPSGPCPWVVVPTEVQQAPAGGSVDFPLQPPDPQEFVVGAIHDLLRCESDQGGSNLRGLELYR